MEEKQPDQSYSLEQLITIFTSHVEEYAKQCKERPEICFDTFNLPLALKTLCEEISACKAALHNIKS